MSNGVTITAAERFKRIKLTYTSGMHLSWIRSKMG